MTFGGKQEERKRLFRNKWCTEKGKKKLFPKEREGVLTKKGVLKRTSGVSFRNCPAMNCFLAFIVFYVYVSTNY